MSRVGLGSAFAPNTPTLEIARAFARDARTYRDALLGGGLVYLYTDGADGAVIAQVRREDDRFVFRSPVTGAHALAIAATDADRLAAHAEGFAEINLSRAGHPKSGVRLSVLF